MAYSFLEAMRPQPTGGLVVTFKPGADLDTQQRTLSRRAGSRVRSLTRSTMAFGSDEADDDFDSTVLDDAGVAIVSQRPDTDSVRASLRDDDAVEEVRPEFWMFAIGRAEPSVAAGPIEDTAERTWGVAAVGADGHAGQGDGIGLAVLDTGIDDRHPDFFGRSLVAESFVSGETARDGQGHGTHCAGTAGGAVRLDRVPRYGVAPGVDLHIGKVLNNQGSGRERDILRGMIWAVNQGCAVISMSLGRAAQPGESHSMAYERVGQFALDRGALIIAAAGNDSSRQFGYIAPVGAPANSPSIMAVAALDPLLQVAGFSSGGINDDGGEVNIAGPGVGVFSSVPRPRTYSRLDGTSMACPHVAGVAALWAASDPGLRGRLLWEALTANARPLGLPPRDAGAGLAQVPAGGAAYLS